jgi:hypothetical protein
MNAPALWNHPAFFGYCDRWMTETRFDSLEITAVKAQRGWDFSADWERQGASWDAITNDMWKAYRYASPVKRGLQPAAARRKSVSAFFIPGTRLYDLLGRPINNRSIKPGIVIVTTELGKAGEPAKRFCTVN